MRRKSYTPPEAVLQTVIRSLEDERPAQQHRAVLMLLARGPLACREADVEDWVTCRAELLQFLRTLVRLDGLDSTSAQIGTYGYMTFTGHLRDGHVAIDAGGRDVRDLVVLQLVCLVQAVGIRNIRVCGVGDCRRLFVKTYRREFCSARCQKRAYMRRRRENERAKRTRAQLRQQAREGQE